MVVKDCFFYLTTGSYPGLTGGAMNQGNKAISFENIIVYEENPTASASYGLFSNIGYWGSHIKDNVTFKSIYSNSNVYLIKQITSGNNVYVADCFMGGSGGTGNDTGVAYKQYDVSGSNV